MEGINSFNRVFVPRGWEQVEKLAPRITAHDPKWDIIPGTPNAVRFIEHVSAWLGYIWEDNMLRTQARCMAKGSLTYGTSFVKLYMDQKTKKELSTSTERDEETGELVEYEEEVEISSLPSFEFVDIFQIDVDPRYGSIEAAPGIVHTDEQGTYMDLRRDAEELNYFNLDKLKEMSALAAAAQATGDHTAQQKLTTRDIPSEMGSSQHGEQKENEGGIDLHSLTVREYWGRFSPTGEIDDEEEYVITTVNDTVVIRCERNPFATDDNQDGLRPFEYCVDHDVPGELYGIGEIEPTETLQIAMNKVRNHRLDNVDLVLNRMWKYDRNAGINPKHLRSFPGNTIPMDDVNGLQPVDTPDVTASSYAEEDRLDRDFERATSNIDDAAASGASGFTDTATGIRQRDKDRSVRVQLKIENFEDALARIARKMLLMIYATEGDSYVIRRRDEQGEIKFTEIQKELLQTALESMSFRVRGGSTISDDYEDRRNEALAQWNLAVAAYDKEIISKEQLQETYQNATRVAFRHQQLVKQRGGGLESLLGPVAQAAQPGAPRGAATPGGGQINPETLTPNGLAQNLAI